jgi:uncharacterized protein YndB with AHSA1/START domain
MNEPVIVPAPVRKSVLVQAPPDKGFEVFTRGMGRWWSKEHSINTSPMVDVVIEPRAGGRWYERGEDGSECQWGHVIVWEAPKRLVLAWQLNGDWKFDASLITEVEIRFTAEGGATHVLEKFGEKAETIRTMIDAPGGWAGLLDAFAKFVATS